MDTLNSWVHVLREHIHSLNLSPKELNEMEHNSKSQGSVVASHSDTPPFCQGKDVHSCIIYLVIFIVTKQFQEYLDPEQGEEKKIRSEEDDVVLPLDPDVLTDNLGFPIVVVCTKVALTCV
jgi:hypothetical protein